MSVTPENASTLALAFMTGKQKKVQDSQLALVDLGRRRRNFLQSALHEHAVIW